jgi:hypothetical protein
LFSQVKPFSEIARGSPKGNSDTAVENLEGSCEAEVISRVTTGNASDAHRAQSEPNIAASFGGNACLKASNSCIHIVRSQANSDWDKEASQSASSGSSGDGSRPHTQAGQETQYVQANESTIYYPSDVAHPVGSFSAKSTPLWFEPVNCINSNLNRPADCPRDQPGNLPEPEPRGGDGERGGGSQYHYTQTFKGFAFSYERCRAAS